MHLFKHVYLTLDIRQKHLYVTEDAAQDAFDSVCKSQYFIKSGHNPQEGGFDAKTERQTAELPQFRPVTVQMYRETGKRQSVD